MPFAAEPGNLISTAWLSANLSIADGALREGWGILDDDD
jgi:hypothetical protein